MNCSYCGKDKHNVGSCFERVRAEVSLVDVAHRYGIELKSDSGGHRARCPLPEHQGERKNTPFWIAPNGKGFKCHSCKAEGNVIEFVMKMDGLRSALESLLHPGERSGGDLRVRVEQKEDVAGRVAGRQVHARPEAHVRRGLDQHDARELPPDQLRAAVARCVVDHNHLVGLTKAREAAAEEGGDVVADDQDGETRAHARKDSACPGVID